MTAGAVDPLVPVSERMWGLPAALSLTVTAPVRVPLAVGVKMTVIAQLAPAASELAQSPELGSKAKSPLIAKLLVKVNVVVPVLLIIAVSTALEVPTA